MATNFSVSDAAVQSYVTDGGVNVTRYRRNGSALLAGCHGRRRQHLRRSRTRPHQRFRCSSVRPPSSVPPSRPRPAPGHVEADLVP